MAEEYDLVILGAGTGGYVAAIKAAQSGLKTAVVEKEKVGGTCLHKGCIPSKALLRSAEVHATIKDSHQYGISVSEIDLQFEKVQQRKDDIVNKLYKGVQTLMKKGKIDIFEGHGRILGPSIFSPSPGTISVEMKDGSENIMLIPKNVIIATGSRPRLLPGIEVDGEKILTSDEALHLKELPSSVIIAGGGVIGIEWASMLADFDVNVTVLEYSDRILSGEDADISNEMSRRLSERGVKIVTNANILPQKTKKNENISVTAEINGTETTFTAETLLMSVGRKANVEDIGLENTDIKIEDGYIAVNEFYQTKESHIYAIGDVIGGLQLAHVASREGLIAVEHLMSQQPMPLDITSVPRCTYSRPEAASIGLTAQQAKQKGYDIKTGKFSFQAIGKALVYGYADGFVKFVVNKENDDLLGVHMIGPHVTDLISEAALAKLVDASNFEISETIHPHPSLSEILGEGALGVEGKAIHS
ncbi:dihydrolipoyl dehydrogenase [Alteribacillus sp. JSM 102045]|uniref:dihydrolipoyl dehydrogenase n=1 Tax=Alteribacillus sp. JSM 102045 TaxID=1562101 RepID=UPI0035C1A862